MARPDLHTITVLRRDNWAGQGGSSGNATNGWWSKHPEAYITIAVVLGVVGIVCIWMLFRENRGLPIFPWRKKKTADDEHEQELDHQQQVQGHPPALDPASWRGGTPPETLVLPTRKSAVQLAEQKIMSPPPSFTSPPLASTPLPAYPFPNRPQSYQFYDGKVPTSPTSPVSPRSPVSPNQYGNQGWTASSYSERSDGISNPSLSTSSVRLIGATPAEQVAAQREAARPGPSTSRTSLPNASKLTLTVPVQTTRRTSTGALSRLSQVTTPDDVERENPIEAAGRKLAPPAAAATRQTRPGLGSDGYPPRRVSFTVQDGGSRPVSNRRSSPPRPGQQRLPDGAHWVQPGDGYNAAQLRLSSSARLPPNSPPMASSARPDALHKTMHTLTHGSRHYPNRIRPGSNSSDASAALYEAYAYGPASARGSSGSMGPPPPHTVGPPVQLPPLDLSPTRHRASSSQTGSHGRRPSRGGLWDSSAPSSPPHQLQPPSLPPGAASPPGQAL